MTHAASSAVASRAQERTRLHKQFFVVRAVRCMAVQAIFAHRCVLPQEGAALLGVTGVAHLIDVIRLEQALVRRAVRIVAILAGHLAFRHRHVRFLLELGTLLLVTGLAGFGNAGFLQQAGTGELGHRVVAVTTGQFVGLVDGAFPENALSAFVAVQALPVHFSNGRVPAFGETDDQVAILGVLDVERAGTVTCLADGLCSFVARIQPEDLGMKRVAEVVVFHFVTGGTRLLAHIHSGTLRSR